MKMAFKFGRSMGLVFVLLLVAVGVAACGGDTDEAGPAGDADTLAEADALYTGKKIAWVDSYHEGYAWSDSIRAGIEARLAGTGVELDVIHLDTRRETSEGVRQANAGQAKLQLDAFEPDVIIASDDNAQQYLIVPFYKDTEMPVVFCGVNWDASIYDYPAENVTGMVEVDLIEQLVENLRPYMTGDKVAILADDTETTHKDAEAWRAFFPDTVTYFTNDYAEYKQAYLDLQEEASVLFIGNNIGVADWDDADARQFFVENATIPTASAHDFISPYVLLTLGKVGEEQGVWAAETALAILDGKPVSDIPITTNREGAMIINLDIAGQLDLALPAALLRNATLIGPDVDAAQ